MGKFIHLDPHERQEIVDNILDKLKDGIVEVTQSTVGQYAITEPQVIDFITVTVNAAATTAIENRLRFKWLRWLLFK